jgi:Lon protease-like protein
MHTSKLTFETLPETISVFPLTGVLLLPHGQLPLNIFEPRYLAMVEDAMASSRIIGMVQPKTFGGDTLYEVGCAGRIINFSEAEGGRYLITLAGLCRFKIAREVDTPKPYRSIAPDWNAFKPDMEKQVEKSRH